MVGESRAMARLREQIAMAAPTNGRVLISGENGTGKELVARHVHALSQRNDGPFVEVNCAALPEELIESELFGHVKGSFTGAVADRRGKFEAASGGTLFLDEVGDMSLRTQAKVLRALQEQVIEPLGGQGSVRVDVRVIAATNKTLADEIRAGRFREDLFFRLNVIPIFVPALRDRPEDVPRLAGHFIAEFAHEYGRRPKALSPEATGVLRAYTWPGNVRELRNVIERLMIMVPGEIIQAADLSFLEVAAPAPAGTRAAEAVPVAPLFDARDAWERAYILGVLATCEGNISRAADALGLERSNLYKKMRSLGIGPVRERVED
jgi:two-component system nitrogen regulation response regulator NtrX